MRYLIAALILMSSVHAEDIPENPFGEFTGKSPYNVEREKEVMPESSSEQVVADAPVSENDYILGPGDALAVSFGTAKTLTVSPEGNLRISGFAPILVSGLSMIDARLKIKRLVSKSYDTSRVFISLSKPNEFKIWITGEVQEPGAKRVNSYVRLTEAIDMAEGFTPYAIRDKILIKRANGESQQADLMEFYLTHDFEQNPILRFGDVVIIQKIDFTKSYAVVRYDGSTQYHALEKKWSLADIYLQVSGYAKGATPTHVAIAAANAPPRDLKPEQIFEYYPNSGDTINFANKKAAVFVGGSVMKPGSYEFIAGLTPLDYAFLAGINAESAPQTGYFVTRMGKHFSHETFKDGLVQPGDKIYMERRKLYLARDYVTVIASIASIIISSATLYVAMNQ